VVSTSVEVSVAALDCAAVEITLIKGNAESAAGRSAGTAMLLTPSMYASTSAPGRICTSAGTLKLTTGHTFYSDLARPLLAIVADSYVGHDTIGGCCSAPSNKMLYGVENVPGCRENFLEALTEHGMGRRDIVPNINLFMEVPVSQDADCEIATGRSKPGDYVDMRAEQDVLVALSNCPQVHNPCNALNPTAIRLMVFAGGPAEIR
jgi:uncharacterized protein YcgI (DUF1989 family)